MKLLISGRRKHKRKQAQIAVSGARQPVSLTTKPAGSISASYRLDGRRHSFCLSLLACEDQRSVTSRSVCPSRATLSVVFCLMTAKTFLPRVLRPRLSCLFDLPDTSRRVHSNTDCASKTLQEEKKWEVMKREDLAQINQQFNQMETVRARGRIFVV